MIKLLSRRRGLIINLGISIIALIVSLVLIEFALRRFYPGPPRVDSIFSYRIPDPSLGWRLAPNTHILTRNWEFSAEIVISSQGWRDIERSHSNPNDNYRILVLGDSFIEAYSVDQQAMFTQQLERMLNESGGVGGRSVEVLNMGVGGYGTLQEYLALIEHGLRYDPDLVLLGFYTANDVSNNDLELETARYDESASKVVNRPFLLPGAPDDWEILSPEYEMAVAVYKSRLAEIQAEGPWWSQVKGDVWWQHTAIYTLYSNASLGLAQRNLEITGIGNANVTGSGSPISQSILVHSCQPLSEYDQGWELTERILTRLDNDLAEAGVQFFVFTVPAYYEVDLKRVAEELRVVENPQDLCLFEGTGHERLIAILDDQQIPYINLLPAFQDATNHEGIPLFRLTDRHWNEAGNQLAAREVLEGLRANNLLDPQIESVVQSASVSSEAAAPHTVNWDVGDAITLIGYSLEHNGQEVIDILPGQQTNLTLYWQASARPQADYTAFAHVEDAAGNIIAQFDAQPTIGQTPTSEWRRGDVYTSLHPLAVSPGQGDGTYQLLVGMYRWPSLERLSVTNGSFMPDDRRIPLLPGP